MATEASKIYAISDLHVNREKNRRSLQALCHHPDDWLIVAGDVSHSAHDLAETLSLLASRFKQVLWTPGNHELWSHPDDRSAADVGVGRYERLVRICREHRVLTPEDPYPAVRCGTTRSEDWHRRFNVSVVVYGHLHVPRTRLLDGVRFEEVSLGYPGQWRGERGIEGYLRQILPAPAHAPGADSPHRW